MPEYRTAYTPRGYGILIPTYSVEERRRMLDPIANARAAATIAKRVGRSDPWRPFRSG